MASNAHRRYLHYDVFTDTPLTGNQLAVFTDPAGLSTDDMTRMTREMNFSECTFIFLAEEPPVPIIRETTFPLRLV